MRELLIAPAPGWPLSVARIGIGLSALLAAVGGFGTLLAVTDGRIARPVAPWLPLVTTGRAGLLLTLLVVASVALVFGLAARPAAAVLTAGLLWIFVWEQQTYSNHVALCLLLCAWLTISPGITSTRPRRDSPSGSFGDQVLLMTQLSVCYAFAAVAKLHPDFLSGEVLRTFVELELSGRVATVLAFAAVSTELLLAVGLWLPRVRVATAVLGVLFHVSIPLAMGTDRYGLVAFSLTCLCLYPLFLTRPSVGVLGDRDPMQHGRVTAEPEL